MNKEKKKIGLIGILVIMLIICSFIYFKGGINELKKNNDNSIFLEDDELSNKIDYTNDVPLTLKNKSIVVEIKGEVKNPDVYELDENCIIKDLIDIAGGITENAEISNINRAKKLQDNELIYINSKEEVLEGKTYTQINKNSINNSGKININSAQLEELKKLNGIGDSKAQKIIEYRENIGLFTSIEDLKNIDGIGEKSFEKLKEDIEV